MRFNLIIFLSHFVFLLQPTKDMQLMLYLFLIYKFRKIIRKIFILFLKIVLKYKINFR